MQVEVQTIGKIELWQSRIYPSLLCFVEFPDSMSIVVGVYPVSWFREYLGDRQAVCSRDRLACYYPPGAAG